MIMATAKRTASSANKAANSKRSAGRVPSPPKRATREPARPEIDVNQLASTQPLATVKARFSEFVDRVHTFRERIVITRNGVPVAVLIDPDELFSIVETLDLLNDPEAMEALAVSKSTAQAGEVLSREELIAQMERTLGPRPR
jgi:prevent-host-death family protein